MSSKKDDGIGVYKDVENALAYLKKLGQTHSPDLILLKLREACGTINPKLKKTARYTLYRWLRIDLDRTKPRTDACRNIIAIANLLSTSIGTKYTLKFSSITNASEMLPIHILKQMNHSHLDIDVEVLPSAEPNSHMILLDAWKVDATIAGRGSEITEDIKRLCKVVEIDVGCIFAVEGKKLLHNSDKVAKAVADGKIHAIGTLANADYQKNFFDYLNSRDIKYKDIHVETVLGYEDAFARLKSGKIQAVVGHLIFVHNCWSRIQEEAKRKKKVQKRFILIDKEVFEPMKMDLFVRANLDAPRLRRILQVLHDSVKYISVNRGKRGFANKVDDILRLKNAPFSGIDVVQDFKYEIMTFETETLLRLWSL